MQKSKEKRRKNKCSADFVPFVKIQDEHHYLLHLILNNFKTFDFGQDSICCL